MPETSEFSADELMRLYLSAPFGENYGRFLDLLIENHALPVIGKSLRTKFHEAANRGFFVSTSDFEDLCSESCLRLVEKLSVMRNEANVRQIRDFNAYAATLALNTWNKFLSDAAPHRKSLKNKIRYALDTGREFTIRLEKNVIYCGLSNHKWRIKQVSTEDLTARLREDFADFRNAALPDLLFGILERAESPLKINDLTTIVARLWAIEDADTVSLDNFHENGFSAKDHRRNDYEMRFELTQIWCEIRALPINQRTALLYNLRDEAGGEMLLMFFNAQIASLRAISEAMNLNPEECAKMLPLLPLSDKAIAVRMNLTVNQIANLRKVARDNLRRRLEGKPKRRSPKIAPDKTDKGSKTFEANDFGCDPLPNEN